MPSNSSPGEERRPAWRRIMPGFVALAMTAAVPMLAPASSEAAPAHVDNPFAGATSYVNPDYAENVQSSIDQTQDAELKAKMEQIKSYPTAVWLDRIAAIEGGEANSGRLSLREHLDEALAQKGSGPITASFVIYDLPGRDCAALASNGELPLTQQGLQRYKTDYIDAITDVMDDPKYNDIRITTVIEPDGLPNLVTNLDDPECAEAKSSGIQVDAVQYALDELHDISNVYTYMDFAHSGWLGWNNNLTQTVQLYTDVVRGTEAGFQSVDGFATNTSNYTPTEEPFLTDPNARVGGQQVRSGQFYEWNPNFDESDFAANLHDQFVSNGWPSDIGTIIDTGRNGWGGSERPTQESSSTDLNTYIEESKVDRRAHRGLWCNVSGAGIGIPPQASPSGYGSNIDAFVWTKPPGESDGSSEEIPNDEGKHADPMCDPDYVAPNAGNNPTGAMPDSPLAGHWFHEQFEMLVQNAHPEIETAAARKEKN
ncbi:Cellulase/cellobiase CelA1 [Actinopolyspora xinjiangensis]|uniref:Glucanase n=1 Tax=Actinopolyspora xinjiangensis TaxID=405564 RepID=A0A1H0RNN2_9ACTN|nr:glycoside hydrolase family 6 protein [Actinopolyspora xinjiangensis]SDP31025.1 Cellulase/cellobiase CelA1 [Actinopolyspora xinjiangensis]